MTIFVVLDTNVLVSATFWSGDSFRILCLIDKGKLVNVTSKAIVSEYYLIIHGEEIIDKVKSKALLLSEVVQRVIDISRLVEPSRKIEVVKDDPDDNKILEAALDGKADYVLTNDLHLLNLKECFGIKIITPSAFMRQWKNYSDLGDEQA